MKIFLLSTIICIVFAININSQSQIKYLSTKLSPYPKGLGLVDENKMKNVMYSKLQTGVGDFFQYYIGTANYQNNKIYWIEIESLMGSMFSTEKLKKDTINNLVHDTIKTKFKDETQMIALELIHNLSTNEIKYVWLNEKNDRQQQAFIFPVFNPLSKGNKLPDLVLEQLNGEVIRTKDLVGKVLVINWWSTNCSPCIAEMPGLNKLVDEFKNNPNIKFIAIADNNNEQIQNFLKKKEFNYIQTLTNKETTHYFEKSYPRNIIVDSDGKICYSTRGGYSEKYLEIKKELDKLSK